jgi:NADPH-dependent 2,4-dienoyl-CoA reductase/sulfur reductase-like enzyme
MQGPLHETNVLVIGGGPAGLGAAARLGELGVRGVIVVDREVAPGGLPRQCNHRGFGMLRYRFPLRGTEFAMRLTARAERAGATLYAEATALGLSDDGQVAVTGPRTGVVRVRARAVIVATGCREMPRPQRGIMGSRPAGIFNTAVVQRLVHQHGLLPGREFVVAGSEDLGLMAVRLLSESGARVCAVVEEQPYMLGYKANYLYSVLPFRVPVLLGRRIVAVLGQERVTGVEVQPVAGGEPVRIPCDALVLAGHFVPESTLLRDAGIPLDPRTGGPSIDQHFRTGRPNVFACGNVLHGAESADIALVEGERTADAVRRFLDGRLPTAAYAWLRPDDRIQSLVPQRWCLDGSPGVVLVRPVRPTLVPRVEMQTNGSCVARSTRLWAVPHRSLKIYVTMPLMVPAGEIRVALTGRVRPTS